MVNLSSKMFCRLDGLTPTAREQERLAQLEHLGLLRHETIPLFDEAVQTAARLLNAPIGILGLIVKDRLWFKAAVGLSRIGLMNELAASRHLPRDESFSTYVIDSHQPLIVNQVALDGIFSRSLLFQQYGVQAYLGVPLLTPTGQCIGALAIWDVQPRSFTQTDVDVLNLTARWCMSEFEQSRLRQENQKSPHEQTVFVDSLSPRPHLSSTPSKKSTSLDGIDPDSLTTMDILKVKLLSHLTEELRTPLTSVMGMARVLEREVYGPLTNKQKEYVGIIHNSGQHLLSLVEEIVGLGVFKDNLSHLQLAPVDIEMLCQQAINNLYHIAKQERQQLRLSVEPGHRIWLLDKEKVRQMLYYLVYTVIQASEAGSEVRIHISRKENYLNIAVWVSHPWLGEGLPQVEMYPPTKSLDFGTMSSKPGEDSEGFDLPASYQILTNSSLSALEKLEQLQEIAFDDSYRQLLGLVLSCHLAELHGGKIAIQGTAGAGYRYVFKLPKMDAE
ncbi:MAG: histidine kinase dimerization/phospho-acceptor domain-containing protein [Spirulinaceae cyanobacterium]